MKKRASSLLGLALLAACSGNPSESVRTSDDALLTFLFTNLSVTPTDTTITLAYASPGALPLAVTLGGETVTATIVTTSTWQNQSVAFTGLTPCTSYSWSIPAPDGTVTGQTNTRFTGNTACPATETIRADELARFTGAEHQEEHNIGCGGWSSSWPVGYGWTLDDALMTTGYGFTDAAFGFTHFSNGSGFCAESTVEVWRSEFRYTLSPSQLARGVTNAEFTANYETSGNYLPLPNKPTCSANVEVLDHESWGVNPEAGQWTSIVMGPASNRALALDPISPPWITGLITQDGVMSFSFGAPKTATLTAGFAAENDGFAKMESGVPEGWAADNDTCTTAITDARVTLTYAALPPETPICRASIDCTTATVTCSPSPAVFTLSESGGGTNNRSVGSFDATGGATPSFTDSTSALGDTYTACAANAIGVTACAPVEVTSEAACPVCVPMTPQVACDGFTCGSATDGCGGTIACGTCGGATPVCYGGACTTCAARSCPSPEHWDPTTCACAGCPCGEVRLSSGAEVCAVCK